jgi:hypothetical protein
LQQSGRQQAVAIAQEALSIAQQAQREALDWERRQGRHDNGDGGGLLAWLRPAQPQLSALRRPQRPDSAALEVAHCLRILGTAHAAVGQPDAAATDLEGALRVLQEAFPRAGEGSGARSVVDGDAPDTAPRQQVQEAQGDAAGEPSAAGEADGRADGQAGAAAAAVSAREHARAARVDRARHELACGLLAELLALVHQADSGSGIGTATMPDLQQLKQRMAAEGCRKSGA